MKSLTICSAILVSLLASSPLPSSARQATTAGQDVKDAGHATKQAAKKTGSATKKGTKKVVNKSAKATGKAADKVEDKTKSK